jgi:hypothetical protein
MSLPNLKIHAISLMLIYPMLLSHTNSGVSERKKLAEYAGEGNSKIGCKITELWANHERKKL